MLQAERRVLEIQTKLHRWARDDPHRRFDDLFNLVADPAFLLVAWDRVRGNKGARTAGVDGRTASSVAGRAGVEEFLDGLRSQLKDRSFRPLPVRERMIPKPGGKLRRLGIATITDRVVQASLKLVLEPIFEADFLPCSYGFRPKRRAHDAVAEVRYLPRHALRVGGGGRHHGVLRRDLAPGPDGPGAASGRGQTRPGLGEGVPEGRASSAEDGALRETNAGTPQGWDPVAVAEQHGPVGAGRAHRPGPGRARQQPGSSGPGAGGRGWPTSGWCGMPTTGA